MPILVLMTLKDVAIFLFLIPKFHIFATRVIHLNVDNFWTCFGNFGGFPYWIDKKWRKQKSCILSIPLSCGIRFFLLQLWNVSKFQKKWKSSKKGKNRVHILTCCVCKWSNAPAWTFLNCLGDQNWYMLKVCWRSELNWKKHNRQMDKQTDKRTNKQTTAKCI